MYFHVLSFCYVLWWLHNGQLSPYHCITRITNSSISTSIFSAIVSIIINNTGCHLCTNRPLRETHFSSLGSMKYGPFLPNENSKWMAYANFIISVTRQRLNNWSQCVLFLRGGQCGFWVKSRKHNPNWCDSNLIFLMRTKWKYRIPQCCELQAYAYDRCRACQPCLFYISSCWCSIRWKQAEFRHIKG